MLDKQRKLNKVFTPVFTFILGGLVGSTIFWAAVNNDEHSAVKTIQDVDRLLQHDDGIENLEAQYIWTDPNNDEGDVEVRRYALKKLVEAGSNGRSLAISHHAAVELDDECRTLYLRLLEMELTEICEIGMPFIAVTLDNESNARLKSAKKEMLFKYLMHKNITRESYEEYVNLHGEEKASGWLARQVKGVESE